MKIMKSKDRAALGAIPVYMIRYEKKISGKLSDALNVSGGIIHNGRML